MRGGKRTGAGRKKKSAHLRRDVVAIRLPRWMIDQLKDKGEIGYVLESLLLKDGFLKPPDDYDLDK
jgi:hypothetical protein